MPGEIRTTEPVVRPPELWIDPAAPLGRRTWAIYPTSNLTEKYIRADLYDALADKWEALLLQLGGTDA